MSWKGSFTLNIEHHFIIFEASFIFALKSICLCGIFAQYGPPRKFVLFTMNSNYAWLHPQTVHPFCGIDSKICLSVHLATYIGLARVDPNSAFPTSWNLKSINANWITVSSHSRHSRKCQLIYIDIVIINIVFPQRFMVNTACIMTKTVDKPVTCWIKLQIRCYFCLGAFFMVVRSYSYWWIKKKTNILMQIHCGIRLFSTASIVAGTVDYAN